jgi:hypothetical protein
LRPPQLSARRSPAPSNVEDAYNYVPKSFLVIGNLQEFVGEHGVNQDKHRALGSGTDAHQQLFDHLRRSC